MLGMAAQSTDSIRGGRDNLQDTAGCCANPRCELRCLPQQQPLPNLTHSAVDGDKLLRGLADGVGILHIG